MPLARDRCICLRKVEYSETSQIVTLLAREHGLLQLIAKGAHRRTKAGASKFGGGLDLLDFGEAVFTHDSGRELGTLCEWELREGHLELRRSLRGIYLALYAAELAATLIEDHDPHPELFDRLQQSLPELAMEKAEEAFLSFQLDLLRETGYLPQLTACTACGRRIEEQVVQFALSRGGCVCRSCAATASGTRSFDGRLLRLVQGMLALPRANGAAQRLPRLTRHQTDPINALLAEHVEHTLGKRLRLPRYVLGRRR